MQAPLPSQQTLLITSDLHLGSPYCKTVALRSLLDSLPDGVGLVLNGDTFDRPGRILPAEHADVVRALAEESRRRRIWLLAGNHDGDRAGAAIPGAETAAEFFLPGRLLALHGDHLADALPLHRWFICWFRRFHALRLRLGARDIHVAEYAKCWRLAYRVLVKRQRGNAILLARGRHVPTIVCGHVHFAEDTTVDGVRYLNTGAWTESLVFCVVVTAESIHYVSTADLVAGNWPADLGGHWPAGSAGKRACPDHGCQNAVGA